MRIDCESGDRIAVEDVNGDVFIEAVSGRVELSGIQGNIMVRTMDGPILIRDSTGQVEARSISGDLEFVGVNGSRLVGNSNPERSVTKETLGPAQLYFEQPQLLDSRPTFPPGQF